MLMELRSQDPDGQGYHAYANVSAIFSKHWRDIGIPVYEEIWNEPDLTECAPAWLLLACRWHVIMSCSV